jgi:DNA polymerase-3 subunit delta'
MPVILGQQRALDILQAAMRGGRMHHAWIFHGPAGVGKATTARWLAQILLCHSPTSGSEACNRCESCRLFNSPDGAHPDLHIITKELAAFSDFAHLRGKKQMNIPIDLLRELMLGGWVGEKYLEAPIAKSPMMRHNKVFVIDEAELLDDAGANALLKTLEEPSPGTYIILITTHEDQLLQTIRSRCQRVAFGPLDDEQVKAWLAEHPPEAGTALTDEQQSFIIKFARGSLGRAKLAVEYNLGEWYQAMVPLVKQTAAGKPSAEFGPKMATLVEAFAKAWVDNHEGASKDAANKAGVRYMLGLLGEMCRFGLRHVATNTSLADLDAADRAVNPWIIGIDLIQQGDALLETNVSVPLLLDNLAIQWAARSQPQHAGR